MRLLTLLSDFGLTDTYVGVMKGTIAQINPRLPVIDLTHQIPPQNVALARFALMTAFAYFPLGTVHVAVVDPAVGTQRRAIAIAIGTDLTEPIAYFVAQDNGLVSGVLEQQPVLAAVELTNARYWRVPQPSSTFHGRDIFAPVGAHLASGIALSELGTPIDPHSLIRLDLPACAIEHLQSTTRIRGQIQATDQFGNAITTIPAELVMGQVWYVRIEPLTIRAGQAYADRPLGEAVALVGSHGWVEVAVNGGSAQTQLHLDWGKPVEVILNGEAQ
jgi:S-adenosylmethionine hydrolase